MAFKFDTSKLSNLADKMGFKNPRPPMEGFYIYGLLFFVGMLVADFGTTYLRAKMLPEGGITRVKTQTFGNRMNTQVSNFKSIKDKNIFNSDHLIPDSLGEKKQGDGFDNNSDPVPTTLPLEMLGTIIHSRHERSVATIQVRGKDIHSLKEDEMLEGMAKIYEITRFKVVFRNMQNNKLEYIEIKEENKIKMGVANGDPIEDTSPSVKTNFSFKRAEINRHLENLPRVLQDAKAVPYIIPGSGGEVGGFKMVAIKAGSIYEKIGLKRNDILNGVNGEPIDSPQKAMEMYGALKNSDDIKLDITRDGKPTTLNYTIEQ